MIMTPDEGALEILEAYFLNVDLTLKLFTNDIEPADINTASSYTEATGGDYVSISLNAGGWFSGIEEGIAQVNQDVVTFSFTGPLTTHPAVYGYYVVNPITGKVIFSERLATPITPLNSGDIINITPIYKLSKGTPT